MADLEDKGRRLNNARPPTLGHGDSAHAWTPDSQVVVFESDLTGRYNIFKQPLDHGAAQRLVAGSENTTHARFSPDGTWLLYVLGNTAGTFRLMRMPASGGHSEEVIERQGLENYYYTTAAAELCVVGEREQNQLIFYAFDPAQKLPLGGIPRSHLGELARTDHNPTD